MKCAGAMNALEYFTQTDALIVLSVHFETTKKEVAQCQTSTRISFELNWCVLTAQQQNWLLAELERLLLSNVSGKSFRKLAASSPTVDCSSIPVVPSQKKRKKKKKRTVVLPMPAKRNNQPSQVGLQTSYFDAQSPPSTVRSRHSPLKVGSDGVSPYDKTIYPDPTLAWFSSALDRYHSLSVFMSVLQHDFHDDVRREKRCCTPHSCSAPRLYE